MNHYFVHSANSAFSRGSETQSGNNLYIPEISRIFYTTIPNINPYWQISGVWARLIHGKFIQPKFMSSYSVLFKFGAWHRPISGKLIQNRASCRKIISNEIRAVKETDLWETHPNMDEFSKNRSSSCPDILQKLNRYSQNIAGWVFQKPVCVTPRKLKFRENFWMTFPGFANKG